MKKYIVTSTKTLGEITFTFDANGELMGCEVSATMPVDDRRKVFSHLPGNEATLLRWPKQSEFIHVQLVPTDLSFDAFWNGYGYKVGDKKRCMKLWYALPDERKVEALSKIQRYKQWAAAKGLDLVYPTTYLAQERFDNVFR